MQEEELEALKQPQTHMAPPSKIILDMDPNFDYFTN
jgi:hypothetical protein